MPIFDFRCRACRHEFEVLVRPGAGAPACPTCAGLDLEKLLSSFAVSSADSRRAAARTKLKKDAKIGADQNIQDAHDMEIHRHEDH